MLYSDPIKALLGLIGACCQHACVYSVCADCFLKSMRFVSLNRLLKDLLGVRLLTLKEHVFDVLKTGGLRRNTNVCHDHRTPQKKQ